MRGNIVNAKSLLQCTVLLSFTYAAIAVQVAAEGYYWRDFYGDIPPDALPGGRDGRSDPIYIGQVLYRDHLIPAKIYVDGKVYFELDREEVSVTQFVKILCTQHPEQMEWIPTTNVEIKFLTDNLIIGGFDNSGDTTYIGRVRAGGEVAIGKVLDDIPEPYTGLHITRNGKGERHVTFEVLAFNPNHKNS